MITNLLNRFGFYKISQLTVGGHCGCCGKPMPKEIFVDIGWNWGLCDKCKQ